MHPQPETSKAILLGFERGVRRIDASKSYPSALKQASTGRQVLDWILAALAECGIRDVVFVGGYHIEKVMERYPQLRFYYHPHWQDASYTDALRRISHELTGPCLISETDILYRAPLLHRMLASPSPVHLGIQTVEAEVLPPHRRVAVKVEKDHITSFQDVAPGGLPEDLYAGILALRPAAVNWLRTTIDNPAPAPQSLRELFSKLLTSFPDSTASHLNSEIAHASDPGSVSTFVLGSKAKTLERLRPMLRTAEILDQICFTVADWKSDPDAILRLLDSGRSWTQVVVRSSALLEDGFSESQAGRFQTILGVDAADKVAVRDAVGRVIGSFSETGAQSDLNEVFIQPQLTRVRLSGVCLTRDLESGAPYVLVNYDRSSDSTEGVTSGSGGNLHTVVVSRIPKLHPPADPELAPVLQAASEIEDLIGLDSLDIEFAIDMMGRCTIFQVRPIAAHRHDQLPDDADYAEEIASLRRSIQELSRPLPGLHGSRTLLGTMPDWNPAEIVGTSPHSLALSLYQHLITDEIWGSARAQIGYRDTYPTPLLIALAGRPYIDVRASLNSFLPASLEESIGAKVVEGGLRRLSLHPEFHDKIEFEIAVTCLAPDFEMQAGRLRDYGLSVPEIARFRHHLLELTDPILSGRVHPIDALLGQVDTLSRRRTDILAACPRTLESLPRTVRRLLQECRRWGTLPFSILARYAFIATTILKSLVARGIFSGEEYHEILSGIPTITSRISQDLRGLSAGKSSRSEFLDRYGHLRPGTYNILSPSYARAPDQYLQLPGAEGELPSIAPAGTILDRKSAEIEGLLRELGFTCGFTAVREFILKSIPGREVAKFEFSHNLSDALDLLLEYGKRLGLSPEEMSHLPSEVLLRLGTDSPSPALLTDLLRLSGTASKRYALASSLRLPHLIRSMEDLDSFEVLEWHPNYITAKRVTAPVTLLEGGSSVRDLRGRIVLIESADPGYDWIFGHPIAGLITQYGGVASHMAVRAAEFRLPAAIGCGEMIFKRASHASVIELDCAARQIRIVR